VICGASIYLLAIESGLSAIAEWDVVRINPDLPKAVERISVLEPHVTIIDMHSKNDELALDILCKGIPLIVLDEAQRSIKVLTMDDVPKAEIIELACTIEKIDQQQDILLAQSRRCWQLPVPHQRKL
jgi:hypothetical protein